MILALLLGSITSAFGATHFLDEAKTLYQNGQYFTSARYAFAAKQSNPSVASNADALITLDLTEAGLYNAASYFFVKTLQSGDKAAIRQALTQTETLMVHVGADILRAYLIRHTDYADYDLPNRSAYLYSLGKQALLTGHTEQAVGYLNGISTGSILWPFALQLRGTANALLNRNDKAVQDFEKCVEKSAQSVDLSAELVTLRQQKSEAEDLSARCLAGRARTLYQMNQFEAADRAYDKIPKESLVWPDILFEQAWNSFGRQQYNRTLGKLVSYKSPALSFVYNSEIDVLRSQSFLALCLYSDANEVINEFNGKYLKLGEDVKKFVESNANSLDPFYEFGKQVLQKGISFNHPMYRLANQFVRGPYFRNQVEAEKAITAERVTVRRFAIRLENASKNDQSGFAGFLEQVLSWRQKTARQLGGAFVKNSLIDYHSALISDFEKMAFIKLEMLSRAKDQILYKNSNLGQRGRGNVEPNRRDDQYFWTFNGEFWDDELGDYVFGLESQCHT